MDAKGQVIVHLAIRARLMVARSGATVGLHRLHREIGDHTAA